MPEVLRQLPTLLYVNGHSLLNRPLEDRQAVLWELQHALQTDVVKLTEGFPAERSNRLMKACAFMGLEGVVMKRKESVYRPGFRSPDWIKVPIHHREEFVVCGYLASSPNHLSSLIVGHMTARESWSTQGYCRHPDCAGDEGDADLHFYQEPYHDRTILLSGEVDPSNVSNLLGS